MDVAPVGFQTSLVGAVISLAAWLILLEVLALATRPKRPSPGPAAMLDVGVDATPPAVVNYLVNSCEVGAAAVAGTLLDLAARRFLTIDEIGPDQFVCRLRAGAPSDATLLPYERDVLTHVRRLAVDGSVPSQALTTGTTEVAAAWRSHFDKHVTADAKERGLTRSRWNRLTHGILAVTALLPVGWLVAVFATVPRTNDASPPSATACLGIGLVGWALLMGITGLYRAERETRAGAQDWARWLGLREYLHRDPTFATAPPAAVAIWGRYLAYGAALGVAEAAVRALPFGAESDHEAWSSYGGSWRMVRVRYPHAFRPGWGWHPAKAILLPLVSVGVPLAAIGYLTANLAHHNVGHLDHLSPDLRLGVTAGLAMVAVGVLYAVIASVRVVICGVLDIFGWDEVEGAVVRLRRFDDRSYVAVDDGHHDVIVAWEVSAALYWPLLERQLVSARVSRNLRYVRRLTPIALGAVTSDESRQLPLGSTSP